MPCPYELQELFDDEDDTIFGGPCAVPTKLSVATYDAVGHQMLDKEGHQSGYRLNLIDFTDRTSTVEGLVGANIGVHNLISGEDLTDNSFAQQMHLAAAREPDVIVATYRSALPILNAIRGYYDACGRPVPILEYVDVSRRHRETHFNFDGLFQTESDRLNRVVEGARTLVIDQYFNSGHSLRDSAKILTVAGASAVTGIVGHWYGDLLDESASRPTYPAAGTVTRLHANFMYQVGLQAAAVQQQEKPQISTGAIAAKYKHFRVTEQYERFTNKG